MCIVGTRCRKCQNSFLFITNSEINVAPLLTKLAKVRSMNVTKRNDTLGRRTRARRCCSILRCKAATRWANPKVRSLETDDKAAWEIVTASGSDGPDNTALSSKWSNQRDCFRHAMCQSIGNGGPCRRWRG